VRRARAGEPDQRLTGVHHRQRRRVRAVLDRRPGDVRRGGHRQHERAEPDLRRPRLRLAGHRPRQPARRHRPRPHPPRRPPPRGPGARPGATGPALTAPAGLSPVGGCTVIRFGLFMAALTGKRLLASALDANARPGPPRPLLAGTYGRLRTVEGSPDGALWLTTANRAGTGTPLPADDRVLRIEPPSDTTSSPVWGNRAANRARTRPAHRPRRAVRMRQRPT